MSHQDFLTPLPRRWKEKTSLNSSDQLEEDQPPLQAQALLNQPKVNQLKQKPQNNNKRNLPHLQKKKKEWTWEGSSTDCDLYKII